MSRGITEHDVCRAADELLLDGLRPTIERVRLKIGRGSPNTVSPHLEGWFRQLGRRLQDQSPGLQAAASPELTAPDPVSQAARQLWELALATAQQEAATIAQQARDDAAAVARQAREDADAANAAARLDVDEARTLARAAVQQRDSLAAQLGSTQDRLATLQQDLAATSARLEDSGGALAALTTRLQRQETRDTEALADLRLQLAAALARADAADRRVALELDRERTLRAKAERRVEAVDAQLERERQSAAQHLDAALSQAQAAEQRETRLVALQAAGSVELAELRGQLELQRQAGEQRATALAVALADAATLKAAFERLTTLAAALPPAPVLPAAPKAVITPRARRKNAAGSTS
jgi:chromosome segregation ATPase